jgi:glycosyltransferase involved in cell wall biosynthesis
VQFRNHVREWTGQDLRDVFGGKRALVNYVAESVNPITGDQQGFHCVRYQVDDRPIGRVDMARKMRYQRPRQTVSTFMIIGGPKADEYLHGCLRSIAMISDELIVADCGMTPEARRIVGQYPAKIIPGKDPKVCGFDEARNIALAETTCDWCLWIDSDEALINAQALGKYLRWNIYDGYSIQQHHFAVDTKFKPDMPVRLFRRVRHDGARLRFFGAIHEHPETEINKGPGDVVALSDVHIGHPGYYHESHRRDRFYRNEPLMVMDKQKNPDRLLHRHFTCRDNVIAVSHAVQQNGGVLTPDLTKKLEEVVRIAQEDFIGKDTYYGIDFLEFYSQANIMLGRGFDAQLSMVAQRDQTVVARHESAFRPDGNKYRFACSADFEAELAKFGRQTKQFDQEYW